ncbi:hypothetical protein QBC34DRAFT_457824 [Podospora aff. communis PSN243]|uniref:DNA 3'-5' helicase n=1 Tax=Podospora aff. communis PSN243 TaxID=3040156 RepID=A0AAV9FY77_9PEZI|nr:hypothetical protein QBC34DRAFT_457824 [Podospora aff. communis PSN243]
MDVTPFIHLPQHPFVICRECRFACIPDEVASHLRKHHNSIHTKVRSEIARAVREIPGIICNQEQLRAFPYPAASTEPIPFIAPPQTDGLRCDACNYVVRSRQRIQAHCREKHRWENDWRRGGNVAKRAKQERTVPWTSGIRYQRFSPRAEPAPTHPETVEESPEQRFARIHRAQAHRFDTKRRQIIKVRDNKAEPNRWLRRVGWAQHLQGLNRAKLQGSMERVGEDKAVLQRMCASLERVMNEAQATAAAMAGGHAVLFEINRKKADVKPNRPFDSRMEEDSWGRYKEVIRKLLCFVQRTDQWEEQDQPPHELTAKQADLFNAFTEAAEHSASKAADGAADTAHMATTDRSCLDAIVALFNHQYKHTHYKNAIISGLAERPENYTPIYSAVIKVARILVLYQAVREQQNEIEALRRTMSDDDAKAAATGLFTIVRRKIQRFMTLATDQTEPTPMDWIFEARTYGMKIRFTTTAGPVIDWVGEQISYQRIRFSMSELSDMLHGLVDEMRVVMATLLMIDGDDFGAVPWVAWQQIKDNHSEDQVGYSFLQDDRNRWVGEGEGQAVWVSSSSDETAPYRVAAVQQYGQAVERFQEGILVAIHMLGGMPARSNDQVKIIHRYLPRVVGELAVWYLWLVLPFWQQVQGADEIVKHSKEGSVGGDGTEEDGTRAEREAAQEGVIAADDGGEEPFDEEDRDTLDSIWDLQARYSTYVVGIIYVRDRQWHRFLGFRGEDDGVAGGGKRKADVFKSAREKAQFRRLARLRMVDVEARLREMMGDPTAQFRRMQKKVISAIIQEVNPISLSFMLPAFCSPDRVTVVIVPLASGIDSHVWQSRGGNQAASIVFVTPESAVTKGFHSFVNRLQGRGQLDQVVMDKCHTVLDSDDGFRSALGELGAVLRGFGVPTVFLTATLGPGDVEGFCRRMQLHGRRVHFFQSRTTRGNVGYRVRRLVGASETEHDEEVRQVVKAGLERYGRGKIVMYSGQVGRAERLAELLGCAVYHSRVNTAEGKARQVQAWREGGEGNERVLVTTNALGMGIDVADIRMVVHSEALRRLWDYAEAVIVHKISGQGQVKVQERRGDGKQANWLDEGIGEFVGTTGYRREGRSERLEGEEACDMCQTAGAADAGEETGEVEEGDELAERIQEEWVREFLQARSRGKREVRQEAVRRGQIHEEAAAFREQLVSWVGCYVVCRFDGALRSEWYHEKSKYPKRDGEAWEAVEEGISEVSKQLFEKRQIERFSGCFYCGVPQGRFTEVQGRRYQHKGVLAKIIAIRVVEETMERDG